MFTAQHRKPLRASSGPDGLGPENLAAPVCSGVCAEAAPGAVLRAWQEQPAAAERRPGAPAD